jgi:quinol monooxygenase YgiN
MLSVVAGSIKKPGKEADLRRAVLALIEPTRREDGCTQYDLHVHTDDPGQFLFYENWTSPEHLDRHAASAHFRNFEKVVGDLLAEPMWVETYRRIA